MTHEDDPFFVVKDEVVEAISKTKQLYERWCEYQSSAGLVSPEEVEWTSNELRKGLRSIEWDLEDLEETVYIVENNPKKFKLEDEEINKRKAFIGQTKQDLKNIKDKMFDNREKKIRQSLLGNSSGQAKYTRLENEAESPAANNIYDDSTEKQQMLLKSQDEELGLIEDSVGTLKTISHNIGSELDQQTVILDDLSHGMEKTESKLETTMKKMSKTLHLSNDRRQWMAIIVLSCLLVILILLFFLL